MNVLVTGGAGFIGSHLVSKLLQRGDSVVTVDNYDPFYERWIKEKNISEHQKNDNYRLVNADIRDPNALRAGITEDEDIDAIVHLAARAGVRPSIQDPVGYQQVNVMGTQNMLEFARERGIGHFVFASSSSVYGVNRNLPWSEDDHVLKPISPYASTKLSGELMGHVYSHLYDIRFLGLRFFTVYGPGQRPDLAIHKYWRLMSEGREIPVFGDGNTKRDYTYIDDIIKGVVAAVDYRGSRYEIVNLGGNRTIKLLDLVSAIETVSGMKADIAFKPKQPGDVDYTWADIRKASRLFGYQPTYDLYKGLSRFEEWFSGREF